MLLDGLQHGLAGKLRQVEMRRARHDPRCRQQVRRMEHRRHVQEQVVGARPGNESDLQRVEDDVGVRQADTLGAARGATGIDQQGIVRLGRLVHRRRPGFAEPLFVAFSFQGQHPVPP